MNPSCSHCDKEINLSGSHTVIVKTPNVPDEISVEKEVYYCCSLCSFLNSLDALDQIIPDFHPALISWLPVTRQLHDALIEDFNKDLKA